MAESGRQDAGPDEILAYRFPDGDVWQADLETFGRPMSWWYAGGPEVDAEISERSGETLERASRGALDHGAETLRGRLALIVVLDGFSRNAYIDAGMDRNLNASERQFFWMPVAHTEDLGLQDRCLQNT